MTKDEFERIIVDDEHKQGLLYLVRKGIEEGNLDCFFLFYEKSPIIIPSYIYNIYCVLKLGDFFLK